MNRTEETQQKRQKSERNRERKQKSARVRGRVRVEREGGREKCMWEQQQQRRGARSERALTGQRTSSSRWGAGPLKCQGPFLGQIS